MTNRNKLFRQIIYGFIYVSIAVFLVSETCSARRTRISSLQEDFLRLASFREMITGMCCTMIGKNKTSQNVSAFTQYCKDHIDTADEDGIRLSDVVPTNDASGNYFVIFYFGNNTQCVLDINTGAFLDSSKSAIITEINDDDTETDDFIRAVINQGYLDNKQLARLYRDYANVNDIGAIQKTTVGLLPDGTGYIDTDQDRFIFQATDFGKIRFVAFKASQSETPLLINLRTGGTISMTATDGIRNTQNTDILSKYADILYSRIFGKNLDSSQIGGEELKTLVDYVSKALSLGMIPLITHGTDTMEISAFILSQLFPNDLIVMTGAFDEGCEEGNDGPINFSDAKAVAEAYATIPRHPYVVIGGKIHLASRAIKIGLTKETGFLSYGGSVGIIRKKDGNTEINFFKDLVPAFQDLPDTVRINPVFYRPSEAEIIYSNAWLPLSCIETLTNRLLSKKESGGKPGLIVEGRLPRGSKIFIEQLTASGIPVFVEDLSDEEIKGAEEIPEQLSPLRAWMKLSILLNQFESDKITALMYTNIGGEMVSYDLRIPRSFAASLNFYTPKEDRAVSFVVTFPGINMQELIDSEVDRLIAITATEKIMVIEGTGNGHIDLRLKDSIIRAISNSIAVYITTRPVTGEVNIDYDVGRQLKEWGCSRAEGIGRTYLYVLGNCPPAEIPFKVTALEGNNTPIPFANITVGMDLDAIYIPPEALEIFHTKLLQFAKQAKYQCLQLIIKGRNWLTFWQAKGGTLITETAPEEYVVQLVIQPRTSDYSSGKNQD